MDNFHNSLNKSLLITLKNDYNNLFQSIVLKYGELNNDLTLENLQSNYGINKIHSTKTIIVRKKGGKHRIANNDNRCMARIWNNGSVTKQDSKIIYGDRCKRCKLEDGDFCGIHSKSLTHGNYNLEPPHNHFQKYLKKLI
jgi:hypothetical protein